jgi:hypothetical protein
MCEVVFKINGKLNLSEQKSFKYTVKDYEGYPSYSYNIEWGKGGSIHNTITEVISDWIGAIKNILPSLNDWESTHMFVRGCQSALSYELRQKGLIASLEYIHIDWSEASSLQAYVIGKNKKELIYGLTLR